MATILLIDDEPAVASANRAGLEAHGYQVTLTKSAEEATAALAQARPDAVVLEPMIEGPLAGFVYAEQLARQLGQVPLVLLTRADAELDRATRRRQDRDGWTLAARFFEKPIPPALLADEVDHLLHEAGGHR